MHSNVYLILTENESGFLLEYWVLTESRIPLKPVLGGMRIVAFSLVLINRLNKTESAVSYV